MVFDRGYFPLFLVYGILFSGCLNLTKDFPEKRSFLLELDPPRTISQTKKDFHLKIRRILVSNKFDNKNFVYRKTDNSYEADFYNEFLVSPQSNLSDEILKYLERKGLFRTVVSMSSRMDATHYLEVEFYSLYGDFRNLKDPKAVLEVNFRIFDDTKGEYELIFRKNYRRQIPIQNPSPESLVSGWNRGMWEIMENFAEDVGKISP